jgi:acetylglutamate kinase
MISPVHDPQTRQTIVRLLSSMGSAKEISQYLKRFSQLDAARFAVVKVGGAVLRDDLESLTSSLAFLQQVGLTPIVVHGAGPQLDAEMLAAGIEKVTVDGLRHTDPPVLAVVRRVMRQENLRLVEALQAEGVRATSIQSGVFETAYLDAARQALDSTGPDVESAYQEALAATQSVEKAYQQGKALAARIEAAAGAVTALGNLLTKAAGAAA